MTQITDRTTIRAILETDRPWAAYALADLEPGFFEYSTWFSAVSAAPALALVYSAFRTPVLITLGKVQVLRAILHELETILNPLSCMRWCGLKSSLFSPSATISPMKKRCNGWC